MSDIPLESISSLQERVDLLRKRLEPVRAEADGLEDQISELETEIYSRRCDRPETQTQALLRQVGERMWKSMTVEMLVPKSMVGLGAQIDGMSDQACCDNCDGTGQLNGKKCATCGGSGRLDVSEGK